MIRRSNKPRFARKTLTSAACALALAFSGSAFASTWSLNSDMSHLSFASIKAGDVGEVHHFRKLDGTVGDDGKATVTIDLSSVETAIDIRNKRMQEHLFHVDKHPAAQVSTTIDMSMIEGLNPGESKTVDATATLSLVGKTSEVSAPLMITRLSDNRIMVQPAKMLMVNAKEYGLGEGVDKLREIAGLNAISKAVPAEFMFVFDQQ